MSEILDSGIVGGFSTDYMDKWEALGFLDGIDEIDKFKLAYMYEIMAFYLVCGHKFETFGRRDLILEKKEINPEIYDSFKNNFFSTAIFPIIRRLFSKKGAKIKYRIFDVFHIAECFRDTLGTLEDKDWNRLKELNASLNDVYLDYVYWFCQYYKRLNRNKLNSRKLLIESKVQFLNFIVESNKTIININRNR